MSCGGRLAWADAGLMEYEAAWKLQQTLAEERADGRREDLLLLVEHPHVFTLGRRGRRENLIDPTDDAGAPVPTFSVDRGGDITYHGPGQLVGYPILRLLDIGNDVVRYLRLLEQALIATCAAVGVEAGIRPPYTGVWAHGRKLASLGVGVRRGVTLHGFALNVSTDLAWFRRIVPCGLEWAEMTSLEQLTGAQVTVGEAGRLFVSAFAAILEREPYPVGPEALAVKNPLPPAASEPPRAARG